LQRKKRGGTGYYKYNVHTYVKNEKERKVWWSERKKGRENA